MTILVDPQAAYRMDDDELVRVYREITETLSLELLHPRAEMLLRGAGLHEMADEMKREQS